MLLKLMHHAPTADIWQIIDIIRYLMLLGILCRETVRDIREREVDIGMPIAYGTVIFLINLVPGYGDIKGCIGGAILGSVIIVMSLIKSESIGIGDGIMLVITGIALGTYLNLILIVRAMIMAGIGAIILIIVRKRRNMTAETMPLMPYILLSYITICVKFV